MLGESTADATAGTERSVEEGRRFARRMYVPRMIGFPLGAVCVGGGLWEVGAPWWVWTLLVVSALGWAHVAYLLALRSRNPYRAELWNLTIDSAFGGAWMAAMHFNLAPTVIVMAMQAMDKAAVGGLKFVARCLAAQIVVAVFVAELSGLDYQLLQSGIVARLASVPLLFCFPIMVGLTAHQLWRRVRQQNVELAALSRTDGLTRLPNHTAWLEAVEREFARAKREGQPASVLMIDLDHFKAINDQHGHQAGDEVLRGIAEVLNGSLRLHDVPGRYGGEEFGVLLPGSDAAGAEAIAERLRAKIEWASFAGELKVTASIGCAAIEENDLFAASWVARADRALYAAKAAGRNRAMRAELKTA
ncbi:MAG TPA: diguanylate cyclase [Burkholderiales bacterium]|nr:diguanylate cyclase [Burkholderiales bacterium]